MGGLWGESGLGHLEIKNELWASGRVWKLGVPWGETQGARLPASSVEDGGPWGQDEGLGGRTEVELGEILRNVEPWA